MSTHEVLKTHLRDCGQVHLLDHWDILNEEEKRDFLEQLQEIDFEKVSELFENAIRSLNEDVNKLDDRMDPVPDERFGSEEKSTPEMLEKYRKIGIEAISKNRVAVLLMAGGQGTRLGVDYPKGMYSVGLPSGKTLFQIQAERIRRLEHLSELLFGKKGIITWYIMTSGPTNKATQHFLKKHDYFGLNPKNVVLFEQGVLPCFDFEGKIIMDNKNRVALAPDGNGGIYRALRQNGIIDDMVKRGIEYVHVHSVDNILIKVADPIFIGYCVTKKADCAAKVVRKSEPSEAVGVVCQVDGRFQVVEYSEITKETSERRDEKNNLIFSLGNICNHFFTVDFLKRVVLEHEDKLKLHVAKKKIPYYKNGERIKPDIPNGIKVEKFVFDVFPFANNFVTWEVPRESEFSALKNSNEVGKDCPSTARRDLLRLHKTYIHKSGGEVLCEEVEVSPLLSYAGELLDRHVNGKTFHKPHLLLWDYEDAICINNINGK